MAQPGHNHDMRFTYGALMHWPEHERWELIDGVPYDMTPAPSRLHQRLLTEILTQINLALKGHPCEVYPAPFDVRLPDMDEPDDEIHTVVQPDLSVVCDKAKLDERGCRGAPEFIIEILSPSTASHDEIRKAALYERHGVREYWTIDPERRQVHVRILGMDGRYRDPVPCDADSPLPVQVVPGLQVDLKAAFASV